MMLITHDLAVVAGLADKIAIMQQGEVVEAGPTRRSVPQSQPSLYARAVRGVVARAARAIRPLPGGRAGAGRRQAWCATIACARQAAVRQTRCLPRRQRGQLSHRARRKCRARRRKRLRQVDAGARHHGAGAGAGRHHCASMARRMTPRARASFATRRKMQVVFQDPYGSFDPRQRVDTADHRAVPSARRRCRAEGRGAAEAHRHGARKCRARGRRMRANTSTNSRAGSASASPSRGR